ncbi:hypothetical protein AX14_007011 [Amanita brunnescens Koide BX004]|nr:hypothetical protein AX14_007011 [Amanita brunnescens Koide BX004]
MDRSLPLNREISLGEVAWLQRKIPVAQRPLPNIIETMMNMCLPRLAQRAPPNLQRLPDPPQAMQLMEHGHGERAFLRPKADVVVSDRSGPQPLFFSFGPDDGVVHGFFDGHFDLLVFRGQVSRGIAS